ncbi:retrovirus-related pol polyprotein from transposon TNT 1-94 [Tanacetum coccineum]
MDVNSAFLNGFINEEVYVAQPPGFIDFAKPNYVYRLKKALYGLKQDPKAWYDRLKAFLIKHDYSMGMVDNTLFTKKKDSNLIIVQIYVDDIIFRSTCQEMCDDFAKIMHDEFEMSMMGELNFFLGLQIKQLDDGIFFNQSKYIKEMLKKFGLEDSKPIKTPMSTETKLTRDEEGESVDNTKYRGMIGSLLYLTASRPDIMFSVCLCARFQEDPKTSHLEAVKRIFRYIKGTTHLGLWYPKGSGIETIVYADSDHAGDYVDRKSTSGVCTFMGCCLTSWFSKKQTALAISTTEAEYVSAGKACQQALWMKQALVDYGVRLDDIPIMCDNKGAIDLSKNPVQHSRTKHIEIRHHFLRDNIQKGNISIEKVSSEDNIADILTKPLKREPFNYLRLEVDELESEKANFSNIYDLLLEEYVSKDVTCSYLHSLSDLNAYAELQCMYLYKVKECECLAQKLLKQTESVNKEVHNKLLKSFAKLENHSISLEVALQQCKEQMKNNSVCKENGSNVFRKEREQYHEIQDLKAQMQDKNIAISELKKLIENCKGKSVETQFNKPSVVRQPNALIPIVGSRYHFTSYNRSRN